MNKGYQKAIDAIGEVLVFLAIFIAIFFLAARIMPNFQWGMFMIQSGSMEPKIKTGDVVVDKKIDEYKENDIITFRQGKKIITHRIMEVKSRGEETLYETKGDANDGKDIFLARKEDVLGKVIFAIPLLGYLMIFVKTKLGILLLIIFPALWIIYQEIMKMKKILKEKNAEGK